jgi:hypothetical protein
MGEYNYVSDPSYTPQPSLCLPIQTGSVVQGPAAADNIIRTHGIFLSVFRLFLPLQLVS